MEKLTNTVFSDHGCANGKNFIENVVENDFAKWNAAHFGHPLELVLVGLRKGVSQRSLTMKLLNKNQ